MRVTDTATLAGLDPATWGDLLSVAGDPGFHRWHHQVTRTGGCSNPIHLRGFTRTSDRTTGQTLHTYSTADEPGGRLRLACGNRRASRCEPCAAVYAADTYHLIRAGLAGDDSKDVPGTVRDHPRVFATFTAPSFGPVHNQPSSRRCQCGTAHPDGDDLLGTPLHPERYDYAGAVLFNNHAGDLWMRFTNRLRREIAARAGLTQRELSEVARVSYGKVAEFQKRGAVHFHAVIRLDGPEGQDAPPAWATTDLLTDCIRAAAIHTYTTITVPAAPDAGYPDPWVLRWGTQLDIRPIRAFGAGEDVSEQAVASYVAKYATKAAESTGTVDRRVGNLEALDLLGVPPHPRRLIEACFDLDRVFPDRKLLAWAHMLGFRGHFSSKSRRYSTTLGALRQVRADYRAAEQREALGLPDYTHDPTVLVMADWQYAGQGHTPGESLLAASVARDLRINRETAREALREIQTEGEW